MVHYKLHFFEGGGRGEFIRQIFAQADVEFEDFRITMDQWPGLKENYLYGQIPVLEVDGEPLSQSYAIGRFLARTFGLAGKDDWEAAKADMFNYGIADVYKKLVPLTTVVVFGRGDKDRELEKLKPEVLEPFFTQYEKSLQKNGGEYFVGNDLTWADIVIADFLERLTFIDASLLDGHQGLKKFVSHIHDLPNIKKHIAHRPAMTW